MAVFKKSFFLVSDWRDYTSEVDYKIEPDLYATSPGNYSKLRYLNTEAKSDASKVNSRYHDLEVDFVRGSGEEPVATDSTTISTSADILSKIMLTPFDVESCQKWKLELCRTQIESYKLGYRTCQDRYSMRETPAPTLATSYNDRYEMLQDYYFHRKPHDLHRAIIKGVQRFNGHYQLKFNKPGSKLYCKDIIYSADIPGITSDGEVVSLESLKAADLACCDVYENGRYPVELVEYNPLWWSKAVLRNAKQLYIGSYNEDGFTNISRFSFDKFLNTASYENVWTPSAAWNFLSLFCGFVTEEIMSSSAGVNRWTFENNGTKNIRCLHYQQ